MQIGVLFPTAFDEPGEYLADARAFEAAGAAALCIPASDDSDPFILIAALAAVTGRIGLRLLADSPEAVTRLQQDPRTTTLQQVARNRVVITSEAWLSVPIPEGRDEWRRALEDAGAAGAPGVMVPADPRLIDLLRNPLDQGDRSDLFISTG